MGFADQLQKVFDDLTASNAAAMVGPLVPEQISPLNNFNQARMGQPAMDRLRTLIDNLIAVDSGMVGIGKDKWNSIAGILNSQASQGQIAGISYVSDYDWSISEAHHHTARLSTILTNLGTRGTSWLILIPTVNSSLTDAEEHDVELAEIRYPQLAGMLSAMRAHYASINPIISETSKQSEQETRDNLNKIPTPIDPKSAANESLLNSTKNFFKDAGSIALVAAVGVAAIIAIAIAITVSGKVK